MKEYILLFDSGLGGEYVLDKFKRLLPKENYIFYCDKSNSPYGNKSRKKLKEIIFNTLTKLLNKYKIKLIIIACNTLSSMYKCELTNEFKNYKVLFVEPKLNDYILRKRTLLIATSNTIKYNYLVKKYKDNSYLYLQPLPALAYKIDNCNRRYSRTNPYLKKVLNKYKDKNISNIIIGCTHYNYIKSCLKKLFGTSVKFYDNSLYISKCAREVLLKQKKLKEDNEGETLILYSI